MPEEQLQLGEDSVLLALRRAWDRALHALSGQVNRVTYESYIRPIRPLSFDGETVLLGVANAFAREWLDKRYTSLIRAALEPYFDGSIAVRFEIATIEEKSILFEAPTETTPTPPKPKKAKPDTSAEDALRSLPLNDRYQLDNFVVGKSNRLAHAAAVAVAAEPGNVYNPLFIYGGPGLGKTHLLHSIAHAARRNNPELRVCFVDGESFTQQFVASLRERKTEEFRRYFRSVGLWLVDDVQFIAGREQTKEEFFHTFNSLYQAGSQIVLASDRSPRELRAMDERLRSRFECGLICDVAKPELETRVAILEQRCLAEGWEIPSDVLYYIASAIQSNIRAIEGAVTKIIAYSSVMRCGIDTELAQEVLGEYFIQKALPDALRKGLTLQTIQHAVASKLEISVEALKGQRRTHDVALARQVAMFLCRELTQETLAGMGAAFGGRDHGTVQRSIAKIESLLAHDEALKQTLEDIRRSLEG